MQSSSTYLNILINIIVNDYFDSPTCMLHFYDDPLLMHPIKIDSVPAIAIHGVERILLDESYACRRFLLQGYDAGWAFQLLEYYIKNEGDGDYSKGRYWDRKYLIIIDTPEAFDNLFMSNYLTFVRDILVVYPILDDIAGLAYDLYTHQYVGLEGNNNPIFLDRWYASNSSFAYGEILYPDKVSNQYGRELRAYCLFGMCKKDPPLGNEYNIIVKYSERFNYTLNSYLYDDAGAIYTDGSGNGLFGGLLRERYYSDICYGTMMQHPFVDAIISIVYTYEVSVPIPKIKYGYFIFMDTFKLNIWALIIMTMVFFKATVFLRRKYIHNEHYDDVSLFDTLTLNGYLVNQPSELTDDVKDSKLLKYLLLLLLFFSVLLVTAFNSRLASVMMSPLYENDINTLEELARSELKLMFFDEYYDLLETDTREVYKQLFSRIELFPAPYNYKLFADKLDSGNYAVARMRRQFGQYDEDYELMYPMYGRYKTIKPDLFTNYYYFMQRKNSMHTEGLARLVATANEVGLMQFWEADGARKNFYLQYEEDADDVYLKHGPTEALKTHLDMDNLKGVFTLWCCGMVIAVFIFGIELLIQQLTITIYYYSY